MEIRLERSFNSCRESARIAGVNETFIHRFYVILQSISSGFELNIEEFNQCTKDTAKLFVIDYPWFYIPVNVHKILVHGADIVLWAILLIGQLTKEAQESRNNDLQVLQKKSRDKNNSVVNERRLFNLLLVSSDTSIQRLTKLPPPKKVTKTYCPQASKYQPFRKNWKIWIVLKLLPQKVILMTLVTKFDDTSDEIPHKFHWK